MKIKVHNPNDLPLIDYRNLKDFQGDLKDLTDEGYSKLLKSLKQHGFFVPFYVWYHDGNMYNLDGHQRVRTLKKAKCTPYKLPHIKIEAESIEEAKQKLLVISSQYGTMTQEGFDEFTFDLSDDWIQDTVKFDALFEPVHFPDEKEDKPKGKVERDIVVKHEVLDEYQELAGYKTAINRDKLSSPIAFLKKSDLLVGKVLDYGCGREEHQYNKFDPYYQPEYELLKTKYDTIICNYVLNVIPLEHNRFELIRTVESMLTDEGYAYFSIYGKDSVDTHTNKGFQSGWSREQWFEFISSVIPCQEIPADFWLFRINKTY